MDGSVSDSAAIQSPVGLRTGHRLGYRALGTSALFAAYAEGDPAALAFYAHNPWSAEARMEAARQAAAHPRDRDALAEALLDQNAAWWGEDEEAVRASIGRLRDPESVAVVTGQQLGLFGGPLYTVYKALTAVRLAEQVAAEAGRPAVPVFWLADEDHDFAEVQTTAVPVGPDLVRIAYDDREPPEVNRGPVGRLVLEERALTHALDAMGGALAGPFAADALAALRADWQPGTTWRDAFARTLRRLTAGTGLVFISADDARLKRLATPLVRQEIEGWPSTHRALDNVSQKLEAAGFHAQIAPRPVNLFLFAEGGERLPVDPDGDDFVLRGTTTRFSAAELLRLAETAPERFSPNVVLRPVMQDGLLPTVAYISGPGETAYFAQLKPVYEAFGVPMPVLYPRASLTILSEKQQRHLDRYGLTLPDLNGDLAPLHRRLALERADADLDATFAQARATLDALVEAAKPVVTGVDTSLKQAVEAARAKMTNALARLEKKTVRVEKRNQQVILDRLERLVAALMPDGAPQERVLSPIALLATEGPEVASRLLEALDTDTRSHQVLHRP
ncbi:MAG: bacillithiol biosynthesis cysteine-adding enzyme BshC [Rhodothermaceae bacterium]|nr:bacillithiol biosynthesis cysteine-adding enzyme BshC [Rhodothermaceae bacterium]